MSIYHEQEFGLASLIAKERLTLERETHDFDHVIEAVLPANLATPLIIGIDGSVTAGKSFLSSRMDAFLRRQGIDCVVIHGDWYMSSRKRRTQEVEAATRGRYDMATFDMAVCNYEEIAATQAQVFDFLQSGNDSLNFKLSGAYSRDSGELDATIDLSITNKSIVIFEGTGVINSIMKPKFDLSIRLDVGTYDETVKRLCRRESEKEVSLRIPEEQVKKRYDLIDYRYDGYLRSRDSGYFDVLLDTSNEALTAIYKRN